MKAVVFRGKGRLSVEDVPRPIPGAGDAVVRITTTTICSTDVQIVRGEHAVRPGLILGHEPVGVIDALGPGLDGLYAVGERVVVGAITPCGQCYYCQSGSHSPCGSAAGGWRFGNSINGAWAEYLLVPDAKSSLASIPRGLADEDAVLCPDLFSLALSGAEAGGVRVGDSVAVFAQGPLGLCAALGAKLKGASLVVSIGSVRDRLDVARRFGATVTLNINEGDPIREIKRLTDGRGADVAIEAFGTQDAFETALKAIRRGGTLASLGIRGGKMIAPYQAFYAGLGDQRIVTALCPGGRERMRRLMALIEHRRVDLSPLVSHHFGLDDIDSAIELFAHPRDGVLKVALHPGMPRASRPEHLTGVGVGQEC